MNKRFLFLTIFLITVLGLISYKITHAFFSNTGSSTGNIFAASEVFPTATPSATPTISISPTPSIANHAVISEVQINGGPGEADHDFIELYNPTDSVFDLNGHRLVKRTGNSSTDTTIKSWTTSTLIPAHGFYLWANNSDSTFPTTIGADTSTNQDLTASHSIALRSGAENTGTVVDALSWNEGSTIGEGTVFSPNPDGDQSIERKALSTSDATSMTSGADVSKGNGFDLNNNSTDFILRTVSQPQNSTSTTETP